MWTVYAYACVNIYTHVCFYISIGICICSYVYAEPETHLTSLASENSLDVFHQPALSWLGLSGLLPSLVFVTDYQYTKVTNFQLKVIIQNFRK